MKPTKDLFIECNEGGKMPPQQFEETTCKVCKNRTCVRAGWAFSTWDKRILTQVDRLLDNPSIALQTDSSRWDGIANLEGFKESQTIEVWGAPKSDLILIDSPKPPPQEPTPLPPQELPIEPPKETLIPPQVQERVEPLTVPPQAPAPEPIEEEPPPLATPPIEPTHASSLNTPPQPVYLGAGSPPPQERPAPKNFSSDPWAVTETLPVGGKFKMGR